MLCAFQLAPLIVNGVARVFGYMCGRNAVSDDLASLFIRGLLCRNDVSDFVFQLAPIGLIAEGVDY